jgi:uncharacterized membrane protein YoaK (UPF0700 family)
MHCVLPPTSTPSSEDLNARPPRRLGAVNAAVAHFRQETDLTSILLEVELLLLAIAIGIQDAVSFPDFHCFASNQTGNTVLFAVGVLLDGPSTSEKPLLAISTIGVSLGFFSLGVLLTGQTANYFNISHKRGWLVLSSVLQTMLVYIAGALHWHYKDSVGPDNTIGRVLLGLLAFSSGSQVAVVRGLKVTDITTAMATAAYIDIFIDRNLFAKLSENRGRNRRILFLLMLVVGSFIGAGVGAKTNFGVAVLVSAVIKTVVAFLFLFNREQDCGLEMAK